MGRAGGRSAPRPAAKGDEEMNGTEETLERIRLRLQFCMSVVGGWFGTYMMLRFGHFASAATVNLLEMLTGAAQENWSQALLRLGGVTVYTLSIFLAVCLPRYTRSDLRRWAIAMDMAVAAVLCTVPAEAVYGVYLSLFAMAFQWVVFAGERGYPCSTVFSTNNLRQLVDAWVQVVLNGDKAHSPRLRLYGGSLLCFYTAAVVVCILWRLGWGQWIILGALAPSGLALVWQRQDLRLRQRMEAAAPQKLQG